MDITVAVTSESSS